MNANDEQELAFVVVVGLVVMYGGSALIIRGYF